MNVSKKSTQSQRQRFIEAAKESGAVESEAVFDATLKKIASAKVVSGKAKTAKKKR